MAPAMLVVFLFVGTSLCSAAGSKCDAPGVDSCCRMKAGCLPKDCDLTMQKCDELMQRHENVKANRKAPLDDDKAEAELADEMYDNEYQRRPDDYYEQTTDSYELSPYEFHKWKLLIEPPFLRTPFYLPNRHWGHVAGPVHFDPIRLAHYFRPLEAHDFTAPLLSAPTAADEYHSGNPHPSPESAPGNPHSERQLVGRAPLTTRRRFTNLSKRYLLDYGKYRKQYGRVAARHDIF